MKNRRHIDVITKYFYPVTAGIESNIIETYSVLAKMGWSVTVHTTKSTLNEVNILRSNEMNRGIKIMRYPSHYFGFTPIIDYRKTNLICLHNFDIFPHLFILLRATFHQLTSTKSYGIFLTPHGGFTPEWPTFSLLSRVLKWLYHSTFGLIMINQMTDGVRAISNWEKQALAKVCIKSRKIVLIENGLDPSARLPHSSLVSPKIKHLTHDLKTYIISIGRIAPIKNYETIIKAISLIPSKLKLVIIGPVQNEKYRASLEHLARKLSVSDRVIFLGVIRGSDKYYLVTQALLFIHMAKWESFCNVVYEAMSLGKICVVADNTALSSLIKNNKTGISTPTFDSVKLAHILTSIHKGKSTKIIKIIQTNLHTMHFPSWTETAKAMHYTYLQIVQSYAKNI